MKTKNVSFTLPSSMITLLEFEDNKSATVTQALKMYFSNKVTKKVKESNLGDVLKTSNKLARSRRKNTLSTDQIVKLVKSERK